MTKTPRAITPAKRNVTPLQELYAHLDHHADGNLYIAWYGQLRAEGQDHATAIQSTLDHWRIPSKDWYIVRNNPPIQGTTNS